ncbi:hypothetical protein GQ55_4G058900 [Panicum hallii var. hallii]|uniref:Uncharacterized protein n=3 Tax=Panicum hallii TaxID=206008 RepID=A0A2T7DVN9_9POAL|nr:hypothetical protein PAHAL_1G280700 [Panicum hallii]PUZ59645.1 hypothetical protein GQ55_4G058900 [Panicum hallii var. hallii]PVH66831.1 hypothetical protein PAHAL_1G361800 [Panicum hallii]
MDLEAGAPRHPTKAMLNSGAAGRPDSVMPVLHPGKPASTCSSPLHCSLLHLDGKVLIIEAKRWMDSSCISCCTSSQLLPANPCAPMHNF